MCFPGSAPALIHRLLPFRGGTEAHSFTGLCELQPRWGRVEAETGRTAAASRLVGKPFYYLQAERCNERSAFGSRTRPLARAAKPPRRVAALLHEQMFNYGQMGKLELWRGGKEAK